MLLISKSQVSFHKDFSYESAYFERLLQHSHRQFLGFISIKSLGRNNEREGGRGGDGKAAREMGRMHHFEWHANKFCQCPTPNSLLVPLILSISNFSQALFPAVLPSPFHPAEVLTVTLTFALITLKQASSVRCPSDRYQNKKQKKTREMLSISKSQVSFHKDFSYESAYFDGVLQHSSKPSLGLPLD